MDQGANEGKSVPSVHEDDNIVTGRAATLFQPRLGTAATPDAVHTCGAGSLGLSQQSVRNTARPG